jgi:hypothetical protein
VVVGPSGSESQIQPEGIQICEQNELLQVLVVVGVKGKVYQSDDAELILMSIT